MKRTPSIAFYAFALPAVLMTFSSGLSFSSLSGISDTVSAVSSSIGSSISQISSFVGGLVGLGSSSAVGSYPYVTAKVIEDVDDASGTPAYYVFRFYINGNADAGSDIALTPDDVSVDSQGSMGVPVYGSNSQDGDIPVYMAQVIEDSSLYHDKTDQNSMPFINTTIPEGEVCFGSNNGSIVPCYSDQAIDLNYEEQDPQISFDQKVIEAEKDLEFSDTGTTTDQNLANYRDNVNIPAVHTPFNLTANEDVPFTFGPLPTDTESGDQSSSSNISNPSLNSGDLSVPAVSGRQ